MTTFPDDALQTPQREVQRLLGRCLLRLQQYERLAKAVMAHHEISGPADADALEAGRAARVAANGRKTLGNLVGDLLGSYVVTNVIDTPVEATASPPEDINSFSIRTSVHLPEAIFVQTEKDLKELVLLRNNLVHHFIEEHDLWSLDGCRGAHDALVAAYNRIDHQLEKLREWAEDMQKVRREMAEFIQSDGVLELIVNGIAPDGTVHWPAAGIVYALREAATELAIDGWTSVVEASKRIVEREPDQLPAKYGCRSWRQVVHESRIFELQYFEMDGQRSPWYREKGSANSH